MQYRYNVDIVSPKGEVLKRYGGNYLDIHCEGKWEKGFEKTTDVLKCIQENGLGIGDIYYIDWASVDEKDDTTTLTPKSNDYLSKVGKSCLKEAKALNMPCVVIYGRPVIKSFVSELNTVHSKELTQKDKYLCDIKEAEGILPRQAFVTHLNLSSTELLERINQPNAFQNLDHAFEDELNPLEKQHLELIQAGFLGGLKDPNVHLIPGFKLVGKDQGAIRVKTDDEVEKDIADIRDRELKKYNNVPIFNAKIYRVKKKIIIDGKTVEVEEDVDGPPTDLPPELPKPEVKSQYPTSALFFGFLFFFCAVPVYTFGFAMVTEGFTPGSLGYEALTVLSQFLQMDPVVIVFLGAALLTVVAAVCTIASFCGGGDSGPVVAKKHDQEDQAEERPPLLEKYQSKREGHQYEPPLFVSDLPLSSEVTKTGPEKAAEIKVKATFDFRVNEVTVSEGEVLTFIKEDRGYVHFKKETGETEKISSLDWNEIVQNQPAAPPII